MAPLEAPLRCLAVRAVIDEAGEIDGLELEAFLNDCVGRHQWLSTTEAIAVAESFRKARRLGDPLPVSNWSTKKWLREKSDDIVEAKAKQKASDEQD